jgi:multidrug efflux pump subunit AcrA (membrane-fusion protein)
MDGTVTTLNIKAGEMVGGSQSAVVLSDLATLVVDIGLDESDVAQVSLDQAALVTLDAFDDVELTGRITAIAPTAQSQSGVVLYSVTITLDPIGLPVRAGMTADVEIVTGSADNVLLIPLKAVRSVGGDSFVLRKLKAGEQPTALPGAEQQVTSTQQRITTQGFTAAPVTLGMITDTYAEVVAGLEEGDVISVATAPVPTSNGNGFSGPGMGFMGGEP